MDGASVTEIQEWDQKNIPTTDKIAITSNIVHRTILTSIPPLFPGSQEPCLHCKHCSIVISKVLHQKNYLQYYCIHTCIIQSELAVLDSSRNKKINTKTGNLSKTSLCKENFCTVCKMRDLRFSL